MLKLSLLATLAGAGVILAACGGGEEMTPPDEVIPAAQLSDIQDKVLTPSCASFTACHHGGAGAAGGLDLSKGHAYDAIMNGTVMNHPEMKLAIPGDPDHSFIIMKLKGDLAADMGERMPYRNAPLDQAKIDAIAQWIKDGCKND